MGENEGEKKSTLLELHTPTVSGDKLLDTSVAIFCGEGVNGPQS